MTTKFVLHGGFSSGKKQQDNKFFQEMLKDAPNKVNILLVYFAEPDEKVDLRTKQDIEEFNANKDSKELCFKVASEENFEKECQLADIIYLHGGKTTKLIETLSKYPNIVKIFSNRMIAGDSAGAHVLGKLFYSKNSKTIGKGLGILPFKIMAHYEDGMQNPFTDVEQELETLLLHEYETKVIQK